MSKLNFLYFTILFLLNSLNCIGQSLSQAYQDIIITNSIDEVIAIIEQHPEVLEYKPTDNRNILFNIDEAELWKFEAVLKRGADPNAPDDAGWTPFSYNTSNFKLYQILKNYGGKPVVSDNPKTDYIARLINDYTPVNQRDNYKIIEAVLNDTRVDLNKSYSNGLTLSQMITINYLTFSKETKFIDLINLLESKGMHFEHILSKDFNTANYPYGLEKGDSCSDIIDKISKHEFYNGRSISYLKLKCGIK